MRLSELTNKQVRTIDGERLGRVHEVHCERGVVTALIVGAGSLIEKLTARRHGRRIAWENVRKVERDGIIVALGSPKRRKG